jgi:hypothetical protein
MFDSRQRQKLIPLTSESRPALRPTQSPVQWVQRVLCPGVKRGRDVTLTTHPLLVPRSWMSRSYTSSPTCAFIDVLWDCFLFVLVQDLSYSSYCSVFHASFGFVTETSRLFVFPQFCAKALQSRLLTLYKELPLGLLLACHIWSVLTSLAPVQYRILWLIKFLT